jgi:hypothetical protein
LVLEIFLDRISEEEFLRQISIEREVGSRFALGMLEEAKAW